jgi:low affinity Fe/Cu permease
MHRTGSHLARALTDVIASPWAVWIAAMSALALVIFGDRLGLTPTRWDAHLLIALATFLMVFVIEHTESREDAAIHTKLDAIIRTLGAETSTVGVEELSQDEINEIRERRRARTPGARER